MAAMIEWYALAALLLAATPYLSSDQVWLCQCIRKASSEALLRMHDDWLQCTRASGMQLQVKGKATDGLIYVTALPDLESQILWRLHLHEESHLEMVL